MRNNVDTKGLGSVSSRPVTTIDKINRVQARFQTTKGQEQTTIDMLLEVVKELNSRLTVAEKKLNNIVA